MLECYIDADIYVYRCTFACIWSHPISIYIGMVYTLAQHKIGHLALVLKASPYNVGVPSWVSLLPSHHRKGNSTFKIFSCLETAAIMPNLVN